MDKERARELKRATTTTRRFSPTKRQQRALSHNSTKHQLAVYGSNGGGDVDLLERWKKERGRGSRGSSSNDDDSEMGGGRSDGEEELHPPLTITTSISSRKRVRRHGKAFEEYNTVDPATVPRKLRSAINKRSSEPVSPPQPDVKKKNHHVINGIQLPYLNGVRKSKQKKMHDPLTKDEEEVAETLFALARMVPHSKPAENIIDERPSAEKSERKMTTSTSLSEEATNEETTKFPLLSTGRESLNISSHVESLEESVKSDALTQPAILEQPTTGAGSQKFDLELNGNSQADLQRKFERVVDFDLELNSNSQADLQRKFERVVELNNATNPSNPMGASSDIFAVNGELQPAQHEATPLQKPEIGLCPVASASVDNEVQHMKEKTLCSSRLFYGEETASDWRPDLPTTTHGHLSWSSSTTAGVWPYSTGCHVRHGSTGNDLSTKKFRQVSADRRRSWEKCVTHVYISHLIRSYQNTEKKSRWPLLSSNQSKHKEGTKSDVMAASDPVRLQNGMDSITSSGTNGSTTERNQHEGGIGVVHDRRLQPDSLVSTQSGIYSQQKPNYDFLSLSAGCESSNPGKRVESSGNFHVSYLHPLAPHHPLMPFSLPNGHYTSPYPDQLAAAAAAQQMQLQLPHYLSNPFCGLHMGHPGGSTKQQQQQQIWQANLAHYRTLPGVPKWQDGRTHDSSPSLIPCAQVPAIFPPSPSIEVIGGSNHSNPQQLQLLPIPSSSSKVKKHQHHRHQHSHHGSYDDRGVFHPEGSSQMQLLCSAQHM